MKKTFALTLILTIALGAFTACSSDDDDNDSGSDLAAKVVGTYVGNLASLGYTGEVDVVVTAVGDNEVLITFGSIANINPFRAKLSDHQQVGVILSGGNPICEFQPNADFLRINDTVKIYTFSGNK